MWGLDTVGVATTLTSHRGSASDARGPSAGKALFEDASVASPCPCRAGTAQAAVCRTCASLLTSGNRRHFVLDRR